MNLTWKRYVKNDEKMLEIMKKQCVDAAKYNTKYCGSLWMIPLIQYKYMLSYQHRKYQCGEKMVVRLSYLQDGIFYTGKMSSLYWIKALFIENVSEHFNTKNFYCLLISIWNYKLKHIKPGDTHIWYTSMTMQYYMGAITLLTPADACTISMLRYLFIYFQN